MALSSLSAIVLLHVSLSAMMWFEHCCDLLSMTNLWSQRACCVLLCLRDIAPSHMYCCSHFPRPDMYLLVKKACFCIPPTSLHNIWYYLPTLLFPLLPSSACVWGNDMSCLGKPLERHGACGLSLLSSQAAIEGTANFSVYLLFTLVAIVWTHIENINFLWPGTRP